MAKRQVAGVGGQSRQLRELVKRTKELSPALQERLDQILDQSVRSADIEFKDLRDFLPSAIARPLDEFLDKKWVQNVE